MRGKKLSTRLNAITSALEAHGIGSFCGCAHPDGVNAGLTIASQLGVELDMEPTETCSNHHPRPMQRSKAGFGPLLLRLLPTLTELKPENIDSAGKSAFSKNGDLKPSRFDMSEYRIVGRS